MIGRRGRCAPRRFDRMRIAFLTGIWPPDVGGPATHGPDFARFLVGRGHTVHVVTMGDGEPAERPCEVEVVSRTAAVSAPLRPGGAARRARGPARRRRLRLRDVCGRGRLPRRSRGARSSRSSSPTPPTSARSATACFHGTLEEFQDASSAGRCAR